MGRYVVFANKEAEVEKFLKNQLKTLATFGCHEEILIRLKKGFDRVTRTLVETTVPKNHLSALPIIPISYLGLYGLANMVRYNNKICSVLIKQEEIQDEDAPKGLYYALDVENGSDNLGIRFDLAAKVIKNKKRFNFTVSEILSLATHTRVLNSHDIVANSSRHGGVEVACLWLDEGGPGLYWNWANGSSARWGSASCGSRIEL